MSIRVMADGRAYNRTKCRTVMPLHKPVVNDRSRCSFMVEHIKCEGHEPAPCDAYVFVYRVVGGGSRARHQPGTFWEDDSDRTRW